MFTEPSSPNTSPLTPVTQLRAPSAPRLPQVGIAPSASSPLRSNRQQPSSTVASFRLPPAFAGELPTSAAGPATTAAATSASPLATDAVLAHRQGFGELCSHQFCQHPWLNSRRRQVAEIDEAAQRERAILVSYCVSLNVLLWSQSILFFSLCRRRFPIAQLGSRYFKKNATGGVPTFPIGLPKE